MRVLTFVALLYLGTGCGGELELRYNDKRNNENSETFASSTRPAVKEKRLDGVIVQQGEPGDDIPPETVPVPPEPKEDEPEAPAGESTSESKRPPEEAIKKLCTQLSQDTSLREKLLDFYQTYCLGLEHKPAPSEPTPEQPAPEEPNPDSDSETETTPETPDSPTAPTPG